MEEVSNITLDEVLEFIKDFPVKPRRNNVIISVDVTVVTDELNLQHDSFSETQYVLASGPFNKDITPGQRVLLDINRMTEVVDGVGKIKIKPIEVNGRMFALITDAVIDAFDERPIEDDE